MIWIPAIRLFLSAYGALSSHAQCHPPFCGDIVEIAIRLQPGFTGYTFCSSFLLPILTDFAIRFSCRNPISHPPAKVTIAWVPFVSFCLSDSYCAGTWFTALTLPINPVLRLQSRSYSTHNCGVETKPSSAAERIMQGAQVTITFRSQRNGRPLRHRRYTPIETKLWIDTS